jgi:hypothetical protein
MIDKQAQMLGMMGMERPGFSNKSAKEIKVGALWADGWVSKRLIMLYYVMWDEALVARGHLWWEVSLPIGQRAGLEMIC